MTSPLIIHTTKEGLLASDSLSSPAEVCAAIGKLPKGSRVVLHFHGGLNDQQAGIDVALALDPIYRAAAPGEDVVPVFFVWESGFMDVLKHSWAKIAKDTLFRVIRDKAISWVGGKLADAAGGRSDGTTITPLPMPAVISEVAVPTKVSKDLPLEPFSVIARPEDLDPLTDDETNQVVAAFQTDLELNQLLRDIAAQSESGGKGGAQVDTALPQDRINQIRSDVAGTPDSKGLIAFSFLKDAAMIVAQVIRRYVEQTDHGLYPTVIEEILREFYLADFGMDFWNAMKQQTSDTFLKDPPLRGGYEFVHHLNELTNVKDLRLTLVGHSAGAVFIINFLRHVQEGRMSTPPAADANYMIENVIFLAPACTIEAFQLIAASPYYDTADGQKRLYRNFRMFAMSDEDEANDSLVPGLYTRSLLYFISGILEGADAKKRKSAPDVPLLGMQRYFTRGNYSTDPRIRAVTKFLHSGLPTAPRVIWSTTTGTPGLETAAREHGGFDEDPQTRRSLQHIIRNGC